MSNLKEELRSLKELNARMREILDMKDDFHDVKCMLVKVLPERSPSSLPSNDNLPRESKSLTGTDRELDPRKSEKRQKRNIFNVNSEVGTRSYP